MSNAVIWPYIFLLFGCVGTLAAWGKIRLQFWLSMMVSVAFLLSAFNLLWMTHEYGPQVLQLGSWRAPFGITFALDRFSSVMLFISAVLSIVINIYSVSALSEEHKKKGFYFLSNSMLLGVSAAFSTGDLFNLFVSFELLLLASFVLMSLGKTKDQLEASIKYVVINFVGSVCFLIAVGLLYGLVGTLNFAHMSILLQETPMEGPELVAALLLLAAFSIKAGLFPLFSWLPASYHTPPTIVTAFFAGLLTKVGVYSLMRVFTLVFPLSQIPAAAQLFWIVSILTMVVGVLGAVSQFTMKRILSVHIISQVGYITLALALFTPVALAAAIYYLLHNIVAKTNLFLIAGVVEKKLGSEDLKKTGGLFTIAPVLSVLFLLSSLALAGIPPLSGFFAKLFVAQAAIELEDLFSLAAIFGVSVLTLFSMLKIWNEAFWKAKPEDTQVATLPKKDLFCLYSGIFFFAGVLIWMGIYSVEIWDFLVLAGRDLYAPEAYLDAVMGEPDL